VGGGGLEAGSQRWGLTSLVFDIEEREGSRRGADLVRGNGEVARRLSKGEEERTRQ
jgi:hypothetical protein